MTDVRFSNRVQTNFQRTRVLTFWDDRRHFAVGGLWLFVAEPLDCQSIRRKNLYLKLRLFPMFTHFDSIAERNVITAPNGCSKFGKKAKFECMVNLLFIFLGLKELEHCEQVDGMLQIFFANSINFRNVLFLIEIHRTTYEHTEDWKCDRWFNTELKLCRTGLTSKVKNTQRKNQTNVVYRKFASRKNICRTNRLQQASTMRAQW